MSLPSRNKYFYCLLFFTVTTNKDHSLFPLSFSPFPPRTHSHRGEHHRPQLVPRQQTADQVARVPQQPLRQEPGGQGGRGAGACVAYELGGLEKGGWGGGSGERGGCVGGGGDPFFMPILCPPLCQRRRPAPQQTRCRLPTARKQRWCALSPHPVLSSLTWAPIQHAMLASPATKPAMSRPSYTHSPNTRATNGLAPGSQGEAAMVRGLGPPRVGRRGQCGDVPRPGVRGAAPCFAE